jgi:hypothetical protein
LNLKSIEQANTHLDSTRELRQEIDRLHKLIAEIVAKNGGTLHISDDFANQDTHYTARHDNDNRRWTLTTEKA